MRRASGRSGTFLLLLVASVVCGTGIFVSSGSLAWSVFKSHQSSATVCKGCDALEFRLTEVERERDDLLVQAEHARLLGSSLRKGSEEAQSSSLEEGSEEVHSSSTGTDSKEVLTSSLAKGSAEAQREPQTLADLRALFDEELPRFQHYKATALEGERLRAERGPLKIAGFTRLWPPPVHGKGGMQYHAMHLYSRLASLGHTVHVFTTGTPNKPETHHFAVDPSTLVVKPSDPGKGNLWVHQTPSKKSGAYAVRWFASALDKFNSVAKDLPGGSFDVAHSESWAAVANSYQLGVPLAVTWHGSMLDWYRNELNQIIQNVRLKGNLPSEGNVKRLTELAESVAFETYALQSVPHHIVISDSAKSDLISADLIPESRVHLVYNGVNEENFKPLAADSPVRAAFRSKHKLLQTDFVVGCGGRLTAEKGHGQLAKAMGSILGAHRDVILLVAGTGGEGKKYEKLRDAGLRVVMVGMLGQGDLATFYASIDVFVDPYWQHHGLNTVMIEASLSGTALVATDLASSRTTIPNAAFGQTFGLGFKDDLERAIMYFKTHPDIRRAVGKNLRQRALKLFTSTTMATMYEQVLYSAVQNPVSIMALEGEVACKDAYPAMCYRKPKPPPS
ncbi:Capsular polysaccharide biosynthesis glycosyltransferase CapM [Diplonema papillatum]|nr:Capsular polysaccharide biosynthesis glycosyltransferase CapM [Diplonema papillatum]